MFVMIENGLRCEGYRLGREPRTSTPPSTWATPAACMEGGTRLGWRRRRAWRAVPRWGSACSVHGGRYQAWVTPGACLEGGTRLGWRRRRAWRAVPDLGDAGGVHGGRYQAWVAPAACLEGGTRLGWRRRREWRAVPGLGGARSVPARRYHTGVVPASCWEGGTMIGRCLHRAWRAVPGLGGARSVPARRYVPHWGSAGGVLAGRYHDWKVPTSCLEGGTRLGWRQRRAWRAVPGLGGAGGVHGGRYQAWVTLGTWCTRPTPDLTRPTADQPDPCPTIARLGADCHPRGTANRIKTRTRVHKWDRRLQCAPYVQRKVPARRARGGACPGGAGGFGSGAAAGACSAAANQPRGNTTPLCC
ncbi:MAG: hypothetical protein J3K34DRAFT_50443 [Monoraphidium minutum]|nr:MAG: hypothetical protein J3K34DRAFT_50443 [Monoraphidium minutum]